ncbi:MAG: hypothetical protein J5793_01755 [Clostridia bacterium]|nr:hypothetical protein [Clostridia bacterium]
MDRSIAFPGEERTLADNANIRILGRHTVVEDCLAFDWSASGFAFNFHGTGFVISLGAYTGEVPAYVKIKIDRNHRQRFAVVNGSEKLIIEGLSDSRHRVEVLKVTEGFPKLLFKSIAFFGSDPGFNLPPHRPSRRIEYIGDSITCGYGVLGRATDPGFETWQEDCTYSYAYLTSESLGAEGRYICISGKGIVCNCEGNREDVKAGSYCEYTSASGGGICDDGWIPGAVVINIGTNDAGGPAGSEEFSEAAAELIAKVRKRYPEAYIVWLYGMMNNNYINELREVVKKVSANDKKVCLLYLEAIKASSNEIGANGHPNVRASVRAANALSKKLTSLTGWTKSPVDGEEE